MDDLVHRLASAVPNIDLRWDAERAARNREAVLRWRRRRAVLRRGAAVALLCGLGLLAGRGGLRPVPILPPPRIAVAPPAAIAPPAPPPAGPWTRSGAEVRFHDGSRVTLLGDDAVLAPVESAPRRTVVRLIAGGARFDVVHDPSRLFRVEAEGAAVEVLGTRFSLERAGRGLHVAVEHGRVRVLSAAGAVELTDGQAGTFGESPPHHEAVRPAAPPRRAPDWRALAEEGNFDRAYGALSRRPLSEVSDEPGELLILADVARLSHHPAQAVPPLRKVVDEHPGDPRAALAAFTLGRVLLDDLGRPQEAAAAFAQAQRLDPAGAMAEDALAREVEAWSRAGDQARARERAGDYAGRYPDGRRLRTVRRYGGLE